MRFDLVDLRLFLLIAESGSITHGAERAGLALASVSARIKGMEENLGVALVDRQRRGIVLTPAGEALLHHAQAVQNQVEAMAGDLGRYAKGLRARVRLLANTVASSEFLPDILTSFLAANRNIDIDFAERPSTFIAEAVASGAADLGIAATWAGLEHLERRPFRVSPLAVIAARDWPHLKGARSVRLDEVVGYPFVGLNPGVALQETVVRQAARAGSHLRFRVHVPTIDAVCKLVAKGAGIGVVPVTAARRNGGAKKFRVLPLKDEWGTRQLSLCARRFDDLTPQAKLLAEALT